ncbi:O-antigen ligase family protein [Bacillus mycoides]|uniref:O-antigen ligase family protein n=1 Tax=Bacillus mycoides TaxID=1405 RepID=UPI003D2273EA
MIDKIRTNPKNKKIQYLFVFTACYSVAMQAFLMVEGIYSILRYILYALMLLILFALFVTKQIRLKNNTIIAMIVIAYISLLIGLVYSIIFGTNIIIESTLLVPLLLIIIGYNVNLHTKNQRWLIYCYAMLTSLVGWYIILNFGNGLTLSGQYFLAQKNQIGAILGVSIALLLYILFSQKGIIREKLAPILFTSILLIMNIIPLFLLRNRTTMLAIIVCFVLVIIKTFLNVGTKKSAKFLIVFSGLLMLFSANTIIDFVYESFFLNTDTKDLNSVSGDRFDVYVATIEFLKNNLWFGKMGTESSIFDPHNFLLYNLYKKGLLLSLGYFIIYFLFLGKIVKSWLTVKLADLSISDYLLIISFITSISEYQQPFGPGTTQLLAWFFIGNELRNGNKYEKKN